MTRQRSILYAGRAERLFANLIDTIILIIPGGLLAAMLGGGQLAILATSSRPDDEEGLAALNAGACGYCHSHAPIDTLRQALDVIAGGELWVGRALLSRLLRLVDSRLPRAGLAEWARPLTEREREVAHHAALGESNVAIADALGITERTVKAHLSAAFEKLGVRDRLQLVLVLAHDAQLQPAA